MTLTVSFRRAARAEFDEAVDRCEVQRAGLGQQFFTEVARGLSSVSEQPLIHEAIHADIRRITLRRFPFNIYIPGGEEADRRAGCFPYQPRSSDMAAADLTRDT